MKDTMKGEVGEIDIVEDTTRTVYDAEGHKIESTTTHTSFVKKMVRVPARSIQSAGEYWHMLGPGLTTGASDDDPSGIATYSQTGAQYGFQLIWLSLFTFPLMAVVQEMCARIGLVTGRGLAANIRKYYSRPVLYVSTALLVVANVFNIGADFGAMAKGIQLLMPSLHFSLMVIFFGVLGLALQIFTSYAQYAKYLKYLALVLISYVVTAFFAHINWASVASSTFMPHVAFNKDELILVCAILGTTISPYLFFWQTSQEVEQKILEGKITAIDRPKGEEEVEQRYEVTKKDIKNMRIDVWSGMLVSNLVMFFIIATCAATLFSHGITNINTASDAAEALRPFAGNFAYTLFAIGIIGTGMLAIPVLAGSAAYAVSESMRWRFGLYRRFREAHAFYGVIVVATILGIALNFIGLDPIKALIYSAVANGIVSPIVLFIIVHMSSREDVMGARKNGPLVKVVGWICVLLMIVSAVGAIYSFI